MQASSLFKGLFAFLHCCRANYFCIIKIFLIGFQPCTLDMEPGNYPEYLSTTMCTMCRFANCILCKRLQPEHYRKLINLIFPNRFIKLCATAKKKKSRWRKQSTPANIYGPKNTPTNRYTYSAFFDERVRSCKP